MDRDTLARLLDSDAEAFVACRQGLLAGASYVVWEPSQPAANLARIYAMRLATTQKNGTETIGFADAVDELRAHGDTPVRIGAVDIDEPPYHFQLFLDEHATAIVACLGVDQS